MDQKHFAENCLRFFEHLLIQTSLIASTASLAVSFVRIWRMISVFFLTPFRILTNLRSASHTFTPGWQYGTLLSGLTPVIGLAVVFKKEVPNRKTYLFLILVQISGSLPSVLKISLPSCFLNLYIIPFPPLELVALLLSCYSLLFLPLSPALSLV